MKKILLLALPLFYGWFAQPSDPTFYTRLTQFFIKKDTPTPEFDKFTRMFAAPKNIQTTVDNIPLWPFFQFIKPHNEQFTPIITKNNEIDRVINAAAIRKIIKEKNLTRLDVPEKYMVKTRGKWGVVAEAITKEINYSCRNYSYTSKEVQQLMELQEEICYTDFSKQNIFMNEHNHKITIIDTESRSFAGGSICRDSHKSECLCKLYDYIKNETHYNDNRLIWNRIEELKRQEALNNTKPIDFLEKLQNPDHTGINFEKVKSEVNYFEK